MRESISHPISYQIVSLSSSPICSHLGIQISKFSDMFQTFTNRHHHTSAGCFNCFECLNNSICDHFNILADSFIFNLIMNICQVWNGSYRTDACAITSNFIHKHSRKLHDIYTSLATGSFLIFITNCNYIIFIKSLIFKYIQLYPHTVYRS